MKLIMGKDSIQKMDDCVKLTTLKNHADFIGTSCAVMEFIVLRQEEGCRLCIQTPRGDILPVEGLPKNLSWKKSGKRERTLSVFDNVIEVSFGESSCLEVEPVPTKTSWWVYVTNWLRKIFSLKSK